MSEKMDIKETKEALVGLIALGGFVAERLKDGADLSDAMALGSKLMDPEFNKLVQDAIDGGEKIPAEIEDLSFSEGIELAALLPDLLKAIQKGSNQQSSNS